MIDGGYNMVKGCLLIQWCVVLMACCGPAVVRGVVQCFPCGSLESGIVTQWNDIISSTGVEHGMCKLCTACEAGAYVRTCTVCHDAICAEPIAVIYDFYFVVYGYLILSFSISVFYMRHFYDKHPH